MKPSRSSLAAWAALIYAAAVLVHSPAVFNGFVSWDDRVNFLTNVDFRGFDAARLRWMLTSVLGGHIQPLSWLTLALDYRLWGLDPFGYHLTNVLIHGANAALVFFVGFELLEDSAPAAAAAAVLWALHPLRVESVAWASERRDVLSAFFALASLWAYLRAARSRHRRRWLGASLATMAISLLCKFLAVVLPPVFLALDLLVLRRRRHERWKRLLAEKIPFLLLAAAAAGVEYWAQKKYGSIADVAAVGAWTRLVRAAAAPAFYLEKTLWPVRLSCLYEFSLLRHPAWFYSRAVVTVTIAAMLWKSRKGRPMLAALGVCYLLTLGPTLGLVQSGRQTFADRFTYLPSLALALAAAALLRPFLESYLNRIRWGAQALLAAALAALSCATFAQIGVWRDSVSLWRRGAAVSAESVFARENLAQALSEAGRSAEAAHVRAEVIRLRDEWGYVLLKAGKTGQAREQFEKALAADAIDPSALEGLRILSRQ